MSEIIKTVTVLRISQSIPGDTRKGDHLSEVAQDLEVTAETEVIRAKETSAEFTKNRKATILINEIERPKMIL